MLIDCSGALQEFLHNFKAVVNTERQDAYCRTDTESASNPIPEAENAVLSQAKLGGFTQICAHCSHMCFDKVAMLLLLREELFVMLNNIVADSASIKHGLCGCEGFTVDHYEGLFNVDFVKASFEVYWVHICYELEDAAF